MINKGKNIEDELRGRQPFRVPDSYFEDFTSDFMSRLPEKTVSRVKVISFYDRVKPWLYMAAMFAGIIVLFNVFNKSSGISDEEKPALSSIFVHVDEGDDADFLDFFEEMYVDKYAISRIIDDYLIE